MFIYVMVYVYFIGVCFLFICTMYKSILEVDFVVEDPNTIEDDPHDTFDQGKWILLILSLCISYCTQITHSIRFIFGIVHNFDGFFLNRITYKYQPYYLINLGLILCLVVMLLLNFINDFTVLKILLFPR
jgi:hypothetical protein